MIATYVLDGKIARREPNALIWAEWMESSARFLWRTGNDALAVSTVFLGIDHAFGYGPPVLFETMVFGGELDDKCWRYGSYDEAERGHKKMVGRVFPALAQAR